MASEGVYLQFSFVSKFELYLELIVKFYMNLC